MARTFRIPARLVVRLSTARAARAAAWWNLMIVESAPHGKWEGTVIGARYITPAMEWRRALRAFKTADKKVYRAETAISRKCRDYVTRQHEKAALAQ